MTARKKPLEYGEKAKRIKKLFMKGYSLKAIERKVGASRPHVSRVTRELRRKLGLEVFKGRPRLEVF